MTLLTAENEVPVFARGYERRSFFHLGLILSRLNIQKAAARIAIIAWLSKFHDDEMKSSMMAYEGLVSAGKTKIREVKVADL